MKPNSDAIKAAVASYFRYTRQCPLVAFECSARLFFGGELAILQGKRRGEKG